jgi:hypothetical protein
MEGVAFAAISLKRIARPLRRPAFSAKTEPLAVFKKTLKAGHAIMQSLTPFRAIA